MQHPATRAVERYYTLFNEKDWPGITAMFDLPATILVGPRKVLLEKPEAVTALYRGLGDKCVEEGVVRVSWDRGSFVLFQVHDDLAIVKTVVTREAADRTPIKTWNCSYTLRLVGADWLFTLITSDDVGDAKAGPTSAST
jgi:hypothetical protein